MDPQKSLGTIVTILIPSNGTSYFYLTKFQKILFIPLYSSRVFSITLILPDYTSSQLQVSLTNWMYDHNLWFSAESVALLVFY